MTGETLTTWPTVRKFIDTEIERLRTGLEAHQPEHSTDYGRGGIAALRRVRSNFEPKPERDPNTQIQPSQTEI